MWLVWRCWLVVCLKYGLLATVEYGQGDDQMSLILTQENHAKYQG